MRHGEDAQLKIAPNQQLCVPSPVSLQYWDVSAKNLVDIDRGLPVEIRYIRRIAHQQTCLRELMGFDPGIAAVELGFIV